ncbi:hypothetical protein MJ8_14070 [Mesorhizobium sp. J8]|nr:hypothetical protein MJ8_14070 [Mesorhizobium sp. J8]
MVRHLSIQLEKTNQLFCIKTRIHRRDGPVRWPRRSLMPSLPRLSRAPMAWHLWPAGGFSAVKLAYLAPRTRRGSDSPVSSAFAEVVEALDIIQHFRPWRHPRSVDLRAVRSVFSDEKKLSITASQTLPDRLIERLMPWSAIRRWNCSWCIGCLVAVVQQAVRPASAPDRHDQEGGDELRRHLRLHRPADDTTRE